MTSYEESKPRTNVTLLYYVIRGRGHSDIRPFVVEVGVKVRIRVWIIEHDL